MYVVMTFCSGDSSAFRMTTLPLSSDSKSEISKKSVEAVEIEIQQGLASGSLLLKLSETFLSSFTVCNMCLPRNLITAKELLS
jgi:hypothetical protein